MATASTPMAMQCSSSSAAARRYLTTAVLALLLLAGQGCRTTSSTTYLPTTERERLTLAEGEATLRQFLELECTTATQGNAVVARVLLDDRAEVLESELEGTTGSTSLDGIIGAVTAQLTLAGVEPMPAQGPARVRVRYDCGEAKTATLELVGS